MERSGSPTKISKTQMEASMMKKNKGKEIQPGRIFITKEQTREVVEGVEKTVYIFELENRRLNIVEFTANFETSLNIRVLLEEGDTYRQEGSLKTVSVLQPFQTKVVARILVEKGYKLDSKFGINLLAVEKKVQYQYAKEELERVQKEIINYDLDVDVTQLLAKEVREILQEKGKKFVDLDFPPDDKSIWGSQEQDEHLDIVIQWKRIQDVYAEGTKKMVVFENQGPNFIKTGMLADNRVVGVLQQLASRGGLIDRLVGSNEVNQEGLYKVQLYLNGAWEHVIVDDYIPCQALGDPLFTHYKDNLQHSNQEIWMLLVEKALAKLMGGYLMVRNIQDQLVQMCTGVPYYILSVSDLLSRSYAPHSYLIGLQCLSEDELLDDDDSAHQRQALANNKAAGLIQAYNYSLEEVVVWKNTRVYQLLNFTKSKFHGKHYSDQDFKRTFANTTRYLYITEEELPQLFTKAIVAMTRSLQEIRLRNKFIRIQDIDSNQEETMSKWCYQVTLKEKQKLIVALQQEDDNVEWVSQQRPILDIGLNVVQILPDNRIDVLHDFDYEFTNYMQQEITLGPGTYILIPKTTGCQLYSRQPAPDEPSSVTYLDTKGRLTDQFSCTLKDIFNKFDVNLQGYLTREESKDLMNYLSLGDSEPDEERLTFYRLKKIMERYMGQLKQEQPEAADQIMGSHLEQLGYSSKDLFSSRSRTFVAKLFSEDKMSVMVKDNLESDLDQKCLLVNICRQGKELESIKGIRCFYLQHPKVHTYTYAVVNDQVQSIYVTLDSSHSQNMLFSNGNNATLQKLVQPDQLVFMYFAQAMTNVTQFYRKIQCTWQHI